MLFNILSFLALAQVARSHGPGEIETAHEIAFREAHIEHSKRSLGRCAHKLETREALTKRFHKRDSFISSHLGPEHANLFPRDSIVLGANSSCILIPEAEEGPYYIADMKIRQDIREKQAGIPLLLDIQVINVLTCEPMTGVMLDFWNANATGIYSDYAAENTVGLTFLRGLQKTDAHGVVQVITTFPGFYQGRAQHVHVKAHVNYTRNANNTITTGAIVHTGQLFFDQSTLSDINAIAPYTEDPNTVTLNVDDRVIQQQANISSYDAFVTTRSLGYDLQRGVIGFINIAINPDVIPASVGIGGGNGTGPGGPGGPGGNFSMSGGPPGSMTGFNPSSTGMPVSASTTSRA